MCYLNFEFWRLFSYIFALDYWKKFFDTHSAFRYSLHRSPNYFKSIPGVASYLRTIFTANSRGSRQHLKVKVYISVCYNVNGLKTQYYYLILFSLGWITSLIHIKECHNYLSLRYFILAKFATEFNRHTSSDLFAQVLFIQSIKRLQHTIHIYIY